VTGVIALAVIDGVSVMNSITRGFLTKGAAGWDACCLFLLWLMFLTWCPSSWHVHALLPLTVSHLVKLLLLLFALPRAALLPRHSLIRLDPHLVLHQVPCPTRLSCHTDITCSCSSSGGSLTQQLQTIRLVHSLSGGGSTTSSCYSFCQVRTLLHFLGEQGRITVSATTAAPIKQAGCCCHAAAAVVLCLLLASRICHLCCCPAWPPSHGVS
jgi:hypothetical protein